MKKIRSFSLFLALFLLFSFTSCVNESGEITTEYTKTVNTEVITQENTTDAEEVTTAADETTAPPIDLGGMTVITLIPTTTVAPEVTTVPEPETTAEPEVTTVPEPETTAEPEVTTVPEPETTAEPEVTTVPEPETTAAPEVTTVPEPEATTELEPDEEYNPAPDFTVYDRNGQPVRLSDMLGKPIVLNFWASWCGPCRSEMPDFDEVYRLLGDEVVFMLVNLTDGEVETMQTATAFVDSMGYSFPVYFDLAGEAAYAYWVQSIPTTYFISARGNLIAYASGALDYETLLYGISMINN